MLNCPIEMFALKITVFRKVGIFSETKKQVIDFANCTHRVREVHRTHQVKMDLYLYGKICFNF